MADNIANILPISSIRLSVESVEVDLEQNDNNSILLSTLQTAFPNSIGIYYRPKGKEFRKMLKFDGRRFMPPSGGWKTGIEYFVEMGGARHSTFPFGSYENASKQFERSVNLVQKMMNGCSIKSNGVGQKTRINNNDDSAYFENNNEDILQTLSPTPQTIKIFSENETQQNNSETTSLKNIEKNFADLSRICSGKDIIIDGLRNDLEKTKNDLEILKEEEIKWLEKLTEWEIKWETAQQELEIMRKLGKDQESLQSKIKEMSIQINNERECWDKIKEELEIQLKKWQKDANDWREKNELSTWAVQELTEQLKKLQREKSDLLRKTTILEEQVNGEAIEFNRRFKEREKIQKELLTDNTRLYQLNEQLELNFKELKEENEKLNELSINIEKENDKKLEIIKLEFNEKENKLNEYLMEKEAKLNEMEAKIKELSYQKIELENQLKKLTNHSQINEGESDPLFAYTQN